MAKQMYSVRRSSAVFCHESVLNLMSCYNYGLIRRCRSWTSVLADIHPLVQSGEHQYGTPARKEGGPRTLALDQLDEGIASIVDLGELIL